MFCISVISTVTSLSFLMYLSPLFFFLVSLAQALLILLSKKLIPSFVGFFPIVFLSALNPPAQSLRTQGHTWSFRVQPGKKGGNSLQHRVPQASSPDLKWREVKSLSRVWSLCHPMDCSLQGFSVHGIFQARVLDLPPPKLCFWSFFPHHPSWPKGPPTPSGTEMTALGGYAYSLLFLCLLFPQGAHKSQAPLIFPYSHWFSWCAPQVTPMHTLSEMSAIFGEIQSAECQPDHLELGPKTMARRW